MTWARFDDGFADHPKIVGLSDAAFRLHVTAICYVARHKTDGRVPKSAPFIRLARAKELLQARVWEDTEPAHYTIHDYLSYNPSASDLLSKSEARAMAGAKGAARRWHSTADAPGPSPVPLAAAAAGAQRAEHPDSKRAIAAWERQSPNSINQSILGTLDGWLQDGIPVAYIEAACEQARLQGGYKPPKYMLPILAQYQAQGSTEDRRHSGPAPAAEDVAAEEADVARARRALAAAEAAEAAR
jgi:hypothetical protein